MITLADGERVYLDSVGSGTIAEQSGVDVVRTEDGTISYRLNREDAKTQGTLIYNTAYNPRGSKVLPLTLNDGTKVWLNAESSLKYPAAFTGDTREVEIMGEAYFEVVHNSKQPFKVHLPSGSVVEDIGTAFNVNAYADEANIKTTLIEGAVKITANNKSKFIEPGQQVRQTNGELTVISNVDIDEVMAWKNGLFSFNRADIKTVMRELARWYDLDVEYEGVPTSDLFGGDIRRDLPLSKALDFLKKSQVNFKVEGKKVIVLK